MDQVDTGSWLGHLWIFTVFHPRGQAVGPEEAAGGPPRARACGDIRLPLRGKGRRRGSCVGPENPTRGPGEPALGARPQEGFHCLFLKKFLLNLLQYCFCFMFWFSGHEACGILAPSPGMEPATPSLEGEILTTGLPGKSLHCLFNSSPQPETVEGPGIEGGGWGEEHVSSPF